MALKAITKKVGIGVGVGVLDIVTETLDQQQGTTLKWLNISNIVRIGLAAGGLGYNAMKSSSMADTLGDVGMVELPLAIRSVYQLVTKVNLAGMWSSPIRAGITQVRAGQGYASAIPPAIAPPASAPSKGYRTFVPA